MSDFVPIATVIRTLELEIPNSGIVLRQVQECYTVYAFRGNRKLKEQPEETAATELFRPPAALTNLVTDEVGRAEESTIRNGTSAGLSNAESNTDAALAPLAPVQPRAAVNGASAPRSADAGTLDCGKDSDADRAGGLPPTSAESESEPESLVSRPMFMMLRGKLRKLGYSDDEMLLLVVDRYRKTGLDKLSAAQAADLDSDLSLYKIARK